MNRVTIRKVTAADMAALQTLSRQTFWETFADYNSAANMQQYLEENLSIKTLQTEFSNPQSEFYFAEVDGQPVGYLKINFGASQTELQKEQGVEIERIYVAKAYLGKKVGQLLFDKAIELAHEKEAAFIWLGVWEENKRAIHFYRKNGFVPFDQHVFMLGNDAQTDIMMKRELK